MSKTAQTCCPGCRLRMPVDSGAQYGGYYNCSAECWALYTEVLGAQFSNAVLFSQVHQLTVDTYAVQHAGGLHQDKSAVIHLTGLFAALELGIAQMKISGWLQRMSDRVEHWPKFSSPPKTAPVTILAVAVAESPQKHVERVRRWSAMVWEDWAPNKEKIAAFVRRFLPELVV